ncbi:MAG: hypothetical protein HY814_04040 [Candidatus Riflebacteria bacterium]|nr:hypothetical protein [Candidatus Riflebacteria bacterium]
MLVHVEVQGCKAQDLARRMYVYNYRLFDRYDRKVASLAVLTDDDPNWRPDHFAYELWGSQAGLTFPAVKLLDFAARQEMLEESRNPFAVVAIAHLKALQTVGDPQARCRSKFELVRRLHERGFTRADTLELFRFIDWVMTLPEELDAKFCNDLREFEEEKKMRYVTSVERLGIKQGLAQGQRRVLLHQIQARFGVECATRAEELLEHLHKPDPLDQVGVRILECSTDAEFLQALQALAGPTE